MLVIFITTDWQHADTAAFHTAVMMSALQADAGRDIAARWSLGHVLVAGGGAAAAPAKQ